MNATARKGVWEHQFSEKLTVIVDTNRNQIIKRKEGKCDYVHKFPATPTTLMVKCMLATIAEAEKINDDFDTAIDNYCNRNNIRGKQKELLVNRIKGAPYRKEIV